MERMPTPFETRIPLAGLELDPQRGELLDAAGRQVALRKQALEVLLVLAANRGHVVTKDELLQRVWADVVVTDDSLVQAITDIRRALGDSAHTLVRTVPRRGYLLSMPAPTADAQATAMDGLASPNTVVGGAAGQAHVARPPAADPSAVPALPPVAGGSRRITAMAAAAAVAITVLAAVASRWRDPAPAATLPQVAVLAFRERGQAKVDDASLGSGLAEDLVLELARNQGLNVVAHHSSFAVSGKGLSTADLGRTLHASYLIDGIVQRDGERLNLEVELIDVSADRVLWVSRQQTDGGQVTSARDQIVAKVAGTLLSKMRETERQRAARAAPKSLDVYALTQRGIALKHQFTPAATREGRTTLERAIQLDPTYGPAWWALGYLNCVDAHLGLSGDWNHARMPEAVAQIKRGIELDPHASMAHEALKCAYDTGGREVEALAATRRAVELGPGNSEAWLWHADALLHARPASEALMPVRRALEMNPLAPVYFAAVHAKVLWGNGQPAAALEQAEDCARKAPFFADCRLVQLLVYSQRGDLPHAREQLDVLQRSHFRRRSGCSRWSGTPTVFEQCLTLTASAGLPE